MTRLERSSFCNYQSYHKQRSCKNRRDSTTEFSVLMASLFLQDTHMKVWACLKTNRELKAPRQLANTYFD
ncbi:hypothetical protein QTG54_006976 [Skeletonema marinoi]|uniref:Uncharacterized protein n=1 Tax=Skeletonema marinoi TaxID=267567 RepID=A0AAD8YBS7_9STRA|nr:hypothetical protein QTG54_006976 [Skeletonema marinoi]